MKRMPDSAVEQARKLIFEDGLKCNEASEIVGYNPALISKRLKEIGFKIPSSNSGRIKEEFPVSEFIAMYESGITEQAIAKHFKISRSTVRDRLVANNVHIRSQSEASILSASKATPDQRKARAKAANIASKGSKERPESRMKRAKYLENNAYEHITGKGELELLEELKKRGIDFTWQKAFGIYSLDFQIGNVALELKHGTGYRGCTDKKSGRIKYLKENGISTIYLLMESVELMLENVDYIVNQVDIENKNPLNEGFYKFIMIRTKTKYLEHDKKGKFCSVEKDPIFITETSIRPY